MGHDIRGIDKQLCRRPTSTGQGLEYAGPDALVSPAMEAIVERLPGTVDGRCVDPAATALDDVDDTADDPPIIHASLARRRRSYLWFPLVDGRTILEAQAHLPTDTRGAIATALGALFSSYLVSRILLWMVRRWHGGCGARSSPTVLHSP